MDNKKIAKELVGIARDLIEEGKEREAFMWTGPKFQGQIQVISNVVDDLLKTSFILRGIEWSGKSKDLQRKMQRSVSKAVRGDLVGMNAWDTRNGIDFSITGTFDRRGEVDATKRNLEKLFS